MFGNEHRIWAADGPGNDPAFRSIDFKAIHRRVKARPGWIRVGDACLYEPIGKIAGDETVAG